MKRRRPQHYTLTFIADIVDMSLHISMPYSNLFRLCMCAWAGGGRPLEVLLSKSFLIFPDGPSNVKACLCLEVKFRLYMCVAGDGVTPLGFAPKIFHEKPKHSNFKGSKHISSRLSSVGHTTHVQITSYSIQDFYFEHLNYNVSFLFHIFFSNTAKLMV